MMKKLFTLFLAGALALSAGAVGALAASPITEASGSDGKPVRGSFAAGDPAATVYCVNVVWGAMEFTYTAGGESDWDPDTHRFLRTTAGAWSVDDAGGDRITVTNHSNAAVTVGLAFEATRAGVTGSFVLGSTGAPGASFALATAAGTAADDAPTDFARLVPGGNLSSGTDVEIGAVTVTLR